VPKRDGPWEPPSATSGTLQRVKPPLAQGEGGSEFYTPIGVCFPLAWEKLLKSFTISIRTAGTRVGPEHILDREATALDFCCASWMLQTSLDRGINWLTLKFLGSVLGLPGFEATIVTDCFNMLVSFISVTDNRRVTVIRGSERLAATAAMCLLCSVSHSLIVDPESNILKDVHQRHRRIFPPTADLRSLPFYHSIMALRRLFSRRDHPEALDWKGIDFSTPESLFLAHNLVKIAWLWHRRPRLENNKKVPRWVLRFSLHSLLSDPEPPVSVIADCLMIIAIDLGCDVSEGDIRNLDKRHVCLTQPHSSLS